MHPDRRGKARLDAALRVDLGGQRVQRDALLGCDLAERAPELFLQRDAGAMAAQGQRMLDRAGAHGGLCRGALPPSPQAAIPPEYFWNDETRISPCPGGADRAFGAPFRPVSLQGFSAPWSARS